MKSTTKTPEYYLIILALLSGYTPPFEFNPIFVGLAAIILLQIIFQNRIAGLIIGILFFVINLFFIGAVLSEFSEFTAFTKEAAQLLLVGLLIGAVNMVAGATLIYKNFKTDTIQIAK